MKTRPSKAAVLALGSLVVCLVSCSGRTNAPVVSTAPPTRTNAPAESQASQTQTNETQVAEAPVPTVPAERLKLPPGVDDVVNLAQAGVGDAVLTEYISHSTTPYELSVDEILYLNDLGVSETVLAAMIRHGNQLREEAVAAETEAKLAAETRTAEAQAQLAQHAQAPAALEPAAAPAPAPAAQPAQVDYSTPTTHVTHNYFYQSLRPYGSWVELPSYGWCWQPTCVEVDPTWRPYCHRGRWMWTGSGWYWASDYSWGWAPFHYGRWLRHHRYHWVWVPGSVWGPSWVSWSYADDYCGWAPLPPSVGWDASIGLTHGGRSLALSVGLGLGADCFSYVRLRHMTDPGWHRHRLTRGEVLEVYNRCTFVNNIVIGDNKTIVNRGIAPERITAVTRAEVPKVELRDIPRGRDVPVRPDRFDRQTGTLAVYRPEVPVHLATATAGQRALPAAVSAPQRMEVEKARQTAVSASGGRPIQHLSAPVAATPTPAPTRTLTRTEAGPQMMQEQPLGSGMVATAPPGRTIRIEAPKTGTQTSAPNRTSTSTPPRRLTRVQAEGLAEAAIPAPSASATPLRLPGESQGGAPPARSISPSTTRPSPWSGATRSSSISRESPGVTPRQSPWSSGSRTIQTPPTESRMNSAQPLPMPSPSSTVRSQPEPFRQELRKIEVAAPSYSPPKMSTRSAPTPSLAAPSSRALASPQFNSAPPVSAPPVRSAPIQSAPQRFSPAPSFSAPAASAPARVAAPSVPSPGVRATPTPSSGSESRRGSSGRGQAF